MTQTFVKRQNTFEAIQFTGGEKSAELVQQWLFENFDATSMYQRHSNRKDGSPRGEIVIMNRRATVRPGYWLTKDAYHGEFTMFTEEEFAKWFVPQEELEAVEMSEESKDFDCCDQSDEVGPVSEGYVGIEEELESLINRYSGESVSGTPDFILAKFLIETLKNYNEAVSSRAEWRGESCEFKPAVGEDYILEQTKYNEDTLKKVRDEIRSLRGVDPSVVENVIIGLQNAGILFRERV